MNDAATTPQDLTTTSLPPSGQSQPASPVLSTVNTSTTTPSTGVTTTVTPPTAPGQPPKVVQSHQIGKYKVEVIREKCISAGSCVAIAPAVFQLDEANIAIIVSQDGNDDDTKLLAAQSCPTAAIIVTDTTTGQQVWPR